jgi:hypothetical protein
MQAAILHAAGVGNGVRCGDRDQTPGEFAVRAKDLALERIALKRRLSIARILDADEWAAAAATGDDIDTPEFRHLALTALMEAP